MCTLEYTCGRMRNHVHSCQFLSKHVKACGLLKIYLYLASDILMETPKLEFEVGNADEETSGVFT